MEKLKARFVANGSKQKKFGESLSPTVSQTSINLALCLTALQNKKLLTLDIKATFLNATMPNNNVIIQIRKQDKIYPYLMEACPQYKEFESKTGILLKLHGALYGLVESPSLWFYEIEKNLKNDLHLSNCIHDKCLFVNENRDLILCLHVDDMLISYTNDDSVQDIINE